MLRNILSVGGWTLISRVTGLVRDMVLSRVLGAGVLGDAFTLAFRLPNHFRAIFGEGAFNSAFVPAYTRILNGDGLASAGLFHGRILTLLLGAQIVLLALAEFLMPQIVRHVLGFSGPPEDVARVVTLTRITFPYLLMITLVTLWSGVLNAAGRFALPAAAPVLLNLSLITALAFSALFASAAHAAAWGVFAAGLAEALLLGWAVRRAGLFVPPRLPARDDPELSRFFKAFLPATIGSAGVQIAMFADSIIAASLPTGSLSALYYADRIYQLPLGVIAIAAGTVLLPTLASRLADGDEAGAGRALDQAAGLTLALSAPFWVAALLIPEPIIRAVFLGGAFTPAAAAEAARVLACYGVGLIAATQIRCAVAPFFARGDTRTPMLISLATVAFNVVLKVMFADRIGVAGLALATALGATLNLAALCYVGVVRGWIAPGGTFARIALATALASLALGLLLYGTADAFGMLAQLVRLFPDQLHVLTLGLVGAFVYGVVLLGSLAVLGVSLRHR